MKRLIPLAVAASVLLAVGAAWAGTRSSAATDDVDTVETTRTQTSAAPAKGDTTTAAAGRAGSVTFGRTGEELSVEAVAPARGWSYVVIVDRGVAIEVTFRKAAARVNFHAELEDGDVEIGVRTRTVSGGDATTTAPERTGTTGGNVTSTSFDDVTSTSFDDDDVTGTSFDDNGGDRDDSGSDDEPGDDNGGDRGDDDSDDEPGDDHGGRGGDDD